jgi:hypothetical protein
MSWRGWVFWMLTVAVVGGMWMIGYWQSGQHVANVQQDDRVVQMNLREFGYSISDCKPGLAEVRNFLPQSMGTQDGIASVVERPASLKAQSGGSAALVDRLVVVNISNGRIVIHSSSRTLKPGKIS